MSILHRIFVSKHKRKKILIGRKTVYKKFLGLKTLKTVLYTKFSTVGNQNRPVRKPTKQITFKKSLPKATKLKFPNFLSLLSPRLRTQEALAAQTDITNFKSIAADKLEEVPEEKFQAFLPQAVWNKMTSEERRAHIKKRKTLAIKKENNLTSSAKYAFSNKRSRPLLNKITFRCRRDYLKNLIKFAGMDLPEVNVAPFGTRPTTELSISNVKYKLQASKKIKAKGSIYKKLTYTSIVPSTITKLLF